MLPEQRRRLVLQAVRDGRTHVTELAADFGVSEMTVRRDLRDLEAVGKLTRVRGGALADRSERPFADVVVERAPAKDAIGRAAAALVADGQTIVLDIGTTALALARHLRGRELTVITSNLAAYEELLPERDIEIVLLGGVVRRNYRSLVGHMVQDGLRGLRADVAFMGTSAVDGTDVLDDTFVEVPVKRAMLAAAQAGVLLADAEKFSRRGISRVCGAEDLAAVVTDAATPEHKLDPLTALGVEVVVAR